LLAFSTVGILLGSQTEASPSNTCIDHARLMKVAFFEAFVSFFARFGSLRCRKNFTTFFFA
jgi:hypothetical protein